MTRYSASLAGPIFDKYIYWRALLPQRRPGLPYTRYSTRSSGTAASRIAVAELIEQKYRQLSDRPQQRPTTDLEATALKAYMAPRGPVNGICGFVEYRDNRRCVYVRRTLQSRYKQQDVADLSLNPLASESITALLYIW
jgi:hypothetical protein